tara:strand:+ start:77 stop:901 length:825 start_codon:yes stop_codon:yes gene_type:complete
MRLGSVAIPIADFRPVSSAYRLPDNAGPAELLAAAEHYLNAGEIDMAVGFCIDAGSNPMEQEQMFRQYAEKCMARSGLELFTYGRKAANIVGAGDLLLRWAEKLATAGLEAEAGLLRSDAASAKPDDIVERLKQRIHPDIPNKLTYVNDVWESTRVGFKRLLDIDTVLDCLHNPQSMEDVELIRALLQTEHRQAIIDGALATTADVAMFLGAYLNRLQIVPHDIFDAIGVHKFFSELDTSTLNSLLRMGGVDVSSLINDAQHTFVEQYCAAEKH